MGRRVIAETPMERRVLEDAMIWDEYGIPFDLRTHLTEWELQAHLAILEGRNKQREKEAKEIKRKGRR